MDKHSKFGAAYEKHLRRFDHGGFSVGNYVKLKGAISPNPDTHDKYPAHYIDRLKEIQDSDLPVVVSSIARGTSLGEGDFAGLPEDYNIVIGQEFARGMMQNYIAVPAVALELTEFEIPDSWKGDGFDDPGVSEPVEADYDKDKGNVEIK